MDGSWRGNFYGFEADLLQPEVGRSVVQAPFRQLQSHSRTRVQVDTDEILAVDEVRCCQTADPDVAVHAHEMRH